MARVAFVLDRIFRRFGLSGRAFMPMIMGFGCSVPATINTRTLADEKERTATIRVIPFFSCGAKLPILTAMAGGILEIYGVGNVDAITFGMYVAGVVIAILAVLLMRNTTQKGETPPFIMELPAYHMPGFKNLMLHLWDKAKHFVKKAFTIIFASTVIIWLLQSFSWNWEFLLEEVDGVDGLVNLRTNESILGSIGMFIQPIFTPLGFGSQLGTLGWVFAAAAITGLVAKENVIATFGALAAIFAGYIDWEADGGAVAAAATMIGGTGITVPGILAFIVFNMTTIPCFAACATAKAELPKGKFKWTVLFWLATSYIAAMVFYTVGSWWWTLFIWLAIAAVVVTLIVLHNKGIINFNFLKKLKKNSGDDSAQEAK
jgi:ferrous iron transport protein B